MKRNAIIRIILYSIAILILLVILGFSIGDEYLDLFDDDFGHTTVSDSIPLVTEDDTVSTSVNTDGLRELEIDWAAGYIKIISDEYADKITITEPKMTQDKYQMRCNTREGKLSIEFWQEQIGVHTTDISKELLIIIPADWQCEELTINSAAASIDVQNLSMLELEVNAAAGICAFRNCNVGSLDIQTASGDVSFMGKLNHLDFEAMSANCQLILPNHVPVEIDMESMSGDLVLELPEDAGFALQMDALSGEFHTDFETEIINGKYRAYGEHQGCMIDISALSGDVTVRRHVHSDDCYSENSPCYEADRN